VRICEELGLTEWPRIVRAFATGADKHTHARRLNLAWRHLTQEQRRKLIEDELRDRPERSNRQIAAGLGVDDATVGDARRRLEATAGIPQLRKTVGADGKARPAQRPKIAAINFGADGSRAIKSAAAEIRAERVEARRAEWSARTIELSNRNAPLPRDRPYPIILVDPPWRLDDPGSPGRRTDDHYPMMSLENILAQRNARRGAVLVGHGAAFGGGPQRRSHMGVQIPH
jgi:hypothetical protein